jgi:hypothetical protein
LKVILDEKASREKRISVKLFSFHIFGNLRSETLWQKEGIILSIDQEKRKALKGWLKWIVPQWNIRTENKLFFSSFLEMKLQKKLILIMLKANSTNEKAILLFHPSQLISKRNIALQHRQSLKEKTYQTQL